MSSHIKNTETSMTMSSENVSILSIVAPGAAEMSAAATTSADGSSHEEQLPPYLQNRFLGALATWKPTEPLDDNNWIAWKGQMTPMLELNDVWGHCDGSDPRPNDPCIRKPTTLLNFC